MRKCFFLALLMCACVTGATAQLLYKISGNALEQPSYIIGTFHLASAGFVDKIPGVREALTETRQVYGEVVWADMVNVDTMKVVQSFMMLPDGQKLSDVLTPEQYQKVNGCVKGMLGVGLDNPQVSVQMGSMMPYALVSQLTMLQYMSKHMGEFDPLNTFDQYFQAQALNNNEPVGGLETAPWQARLMFQSMEMPRQVELLMCFIDHRDAMADYNEAIAKAFYAQDLDAVEAAMDAKMGNACDATAEELETMIYRRNANWLALMPGVMKAAPTFFVVGAGHLIGERGVLQGLRALGYTVEGVKPLPAPPKEGR